MLMAKKAQAATTAPARKPAAKATATAPVVTLKHIAAQIAEAHDIPTNRAVTMLNDTVNLLSKHLVKGDKVRILGLGIFQVKRREARMGRNPRTGEPVKIKASKKVTFRASQGIEGSRLVSRLAFPEFTGCA
jgi:DNA-binding protein HU-beta